LKANGVSVDANAAGLAARVEALEDEVAMLKDEIATLKNAAAQTIAAVAAIGGRGVLKRAPTAAGLLAAHGADPATIEYWQTAVRHDAERRA